MEDLKKICADGKAALMAGFEKISQAEYFISEFEAGRMSEDEAIKKVNEVLYHD